MKRKSEEKREKDEMVSRRRLRREKWKFRTYLFRKNGCLGRSINTNVRQPSSLSGPQFSNTIASIGIGNQPQALPFTILLS